MILNWNLMCVLFILINTSVSTDLRSTVIFRDRHTCRVVICILARRDTAQKIASRVDGVFLSLVTLLV